MLQAHKVRDGEVGKEVTILFWLTLLFQSLERLVTCSLLTVLLYHLVHSSRLGLDPVGFSNSAVFWFLLPLTLILFVNVEVEVGARACEQWPGKGFVVFLLAIDVYQTAPGAVALLGRVWVSAVRDREEIRRYPGADCSQKGKISGAVIELKFSINLQWKCQIADNVWLCFEISALAPFPEKAPEKLT